MKGWYPERTRYEITHNRCANLTGGPGNNIPLDLVNEYHNKEFKGMKMQAIWKLVEAVIIPIMTYAAEGWNCNKTDTNKLQTIFNKALKTLLFLPRGVPTTVLLTETGFPPIELTIKKKIMMHMKRTQDRKDSSLIGKLINTPASLWKNERTKY